MSFQWIPALAPGVDAASHSVAALAWGLAGGQPNSLAACKTRCVRASVRFFRRNSTGSVPALAASLSTWDSRAVADWAVTGSIVELRRASFPGPVHTEVPKRHQPRFGPPCLYFDGRGGWERVVKELLGSGPNHLHGLGRAARQYWVAPDKECE